MIPLLINMDENVSKDDVKVLITCSVDVFRRSRRFEIHTGKSYPQTSSHDCTYMHDILRAHTYCSYVASSVYTVGRRTLKIQDFPHHKM